jgi:hypothetical protein
VLAKGEITTKVTLVVTGASASAVEAVKKAGGTLTTEGRRRSGRIRVVSGRRPLTSPQFSRAADRKTVGGAVHERDRTWHLLQSKWRRT